MTGYVRNDTPNNIADGNVIDASDLDGEFDAIVDAMAVTGHTHDGSTGEGAPVTVVGPAQDVVVSASAVTPKTNNTYDLGSASLKWKDFFIAGTATLATVDIDAGAIDGTTVGSTTPAAGAFTTLGATGVATIELGSIVTTTDLPVAAGGTGASNATDALTNLGFTATIAELNLLDGVTSSTAELNILDGVTSTAAELNILDGVTSTAAELNILDGVTATFTELNILDGVTSTTAELNILDGVTSTFTELNILDGVTATTADLNILDGVTSTTAELNILDGVTATFTELNLLDGVTSTTAELNILDGVTATTAELNYSDGVTSNIQTQLDAKPDTGDLVTTYTSSDTAITVDTTQNFTHSLGGEPDIVNVFLVCNTAEHGYTIGDIVPLNLHANNTGGNDNHMVKANTTQVEVRIRTVLRQCHESTDTSAVTFTNTSWDLRINAIKF